MSNIITNKFNSHMKSLTDGTPFRSNNVIVNGRALVLSDTFSNPIDSFIFISQTLRNGIHKFMIVGVDDVQNYTIADPVFVEIDGYPLAPLSLRVSVYDDVNRTVTLTWLHPSDYNIAGYNVYHNGGSGAIDYNTIIDTISYPNLTWTSDALGDGIWYFGVRSISGNDIEEKNIARVARRIPLVGTPGTVGGPPLAARNVVLQNISIGKVKINFIYVYGTQADGFYIYHDNGSGTIDFDTPTYTISRGGTIYQSYLTPRLLFAENKIFKFGVRAYNTYGTDGNTNEYSIVVDGVRPERIKSIQGTSI